MFKERKVISIGGIKLKKKEIRLHRQILLAERQKIENELHRVDGKLLLLDRLEKPYVAEVSSYSGGGSMSFATEAAARNKMIEYYNKKYYRNGLNYGVYMYKWNEDGSQTLLEVKPKATKDFYPAGFKKEEE
ncbi:hypothetical protein vBBak6_064 [Bacillus phage v_B-Bak6]|uniref:Uncharacterized protein n=2 Tax=Basiliskvirus TaxID=3044670 RepID=A0A385IK17_9CAUD|nr:hypothetical protein PP653_gp094 [Bacillus phage Basilisk]YP_010656969.1 hypothetical protein PP654_gp080 [Bacillus phage v_B-Bak10]AXY83024.1 hypothetical protein vBBak1_064 [Bacillus phage v_B-Bak1]AXY83144.1 hypothetical protein vBBak6_064 [Bacillus phage v_B-Bak6]AGR46617.1 hypothetical protein BASILISK_73 [Bacillus phage Basilisk]AXY83254.1 hypothetical protein vBBBak10_062 [Bacillus phage v_B-Bak10]